MILFLDSERRLTCGCERCCDEKPDAERSNIDDPGDDFIGEVTEFFAEPEENLTRTNSPRGLLKADNRSS